MIALLGRRDLPTDGVEDYCTFLGRSLEKRGVRLEQARVRWVEKGWEGALKDLRRECREWNDTWVLIQYTALSWSNRGFTFPVLAAAKVLVHAGARVAVVFHEPSCQEGPHWIGRLRGTCQMWVIRRLYQRAAKAIFTVPLETVTWLPTGDSKSVFIPIGANLPEHTVYRTPTTGADRERTVIVFGVTGAPQMDHEVEEIADVIKKTTRFIARLRLLVIGRGAAEAREKLVRSLAGVNAKLAVRGILPAEEIAREFENADALLFVRGAITLRRGSAIAGIACGLPIVGYRNGNVGTPLENAGIEWSPWLDRDALVRGLVRVLTDPSRWTELHERNLAAQKNYFRWDQIAERYRVALAD